MLLTYDIHRQGLKSLIGQQALFITSISITPLKTNLWLHMQAATLSTHRHSNSAESLFLDQLHIISRQFINLCTVVHDEKKQNKKKQ